MQCVCLASEALLLRSFEARSVRCLFSTWGSGTAMGVVRVLCSCVSVLTASHRWWVARALKTAAILRPRSPDSSKIRTPTIIMFSWGVGSKKRKGYLIKIKQNSQMCLKNEMVIGLQICPHSTIKCDTSRGYTTSVPPHHNIRAQRLKEPLRLLAT